MKVKSIFLITGVSIAMLFGACQKAPMACFTASKTTAAVNETITFNSDCSMDAHHYEWDFGDGSMSSEANPSHAYSNAGSYTVMMTGMSENMKKMHDEMMTITVQ